MIWYLSGSSMHLFLWLVEPVLSTTRMTSSGIPATFSPGARLSLSSSKRMVSKASAMASKISFKLRSPTFFVLQHPSAQWEYHGNKLGIDQHSPEKMYTWMVFEFESQKSQSYQKSGIIKWGHKPWTGVSCLAEWFRCQVLSRWSRWSRWTPRTWFRCVLTCMTTQAT